MAATVIPAQDVRRGDRVWACAEAGWVTVTQVRRARYFVAVWLGGSPVYIDHRRSLVVETPRPEPCP